MLNRVSTAAAWSRLLQFRQITRVASARRVAFLTRRSYAAGRPRSVVGETTKPVKRATKTATKKPAAKKAAPKKAKKPKKPKKKAAPKKKEVSPELKARRAEKKKLLAKTAKTNALKEQALPIGPKPTLRGTSGGWQAFIQTKWQGAIDRDPDAMRALTVNAAQEWNSKSASDKAFYIAQAIERHQQACADYKATVEKHTPEEIRLANLARARLCRLFPKTKTQGTPPKYPQIADERAPRRVRSPWVYFVQARHGLGEFKGVRSSEASKQLATEWKSLDASEKQKYEGLYQADSKRYAEEFTRVYGHAPGTSKA